MVMELSSDLVEEILSWVPSRSLARLRYTCKHWKTLIADPRFVKKHLSHMRCREQQFTVFNNVPSSQVFYLLGSTVSCVGIDFDELNNPGLNLQVFKPVSSRNLMVQNMYHCDGLLLFVMRTNLLVLNPLLKQQRWVTCSYGFDCSLDAFGLGYISNQSSTSSCNDYIIVRFPCGATDGGKYKGTKIEVYEFKSDSWRVFVDKSFDGFLELPESSVCLRGTPYWIGYLNGKTFPTIQSFDFSKKRFETLFLPPSSIGSPNLENSLYLGVFRGDKLSLLHKSRLTGKIQLWVMKKHWSKLMTVAIVPEFAMFHRYSSYFIENNGKLVLSFRDIKSIHIYIVGKDGDCQSVEYPSMDPSISGSRCYYVPSLLQVPGFFEAKRTRSGFFKKRRFLTMDS